MAMYDQYIASAEHTIYYRYTCNHCKKSIDWIPYEIKGSGAVNARGTYDALSVKKQAQDAAEKDMRIRLDKMKAHVANGYYFEAPFSEKTEYSYFLEDKCPSCGATQKSKKGGFWWVFMYGLIPAMVWFVIFAIAGMVDVALYAYILFIAGTAWGIYGRRKNSKGVSTTEVIYDWNDNT